MRVVVWEYFCSGAAEIPSELATIQQEGRAMLLALVRDLLRATIEVVVVWDECLGRFPLAVAEVVTANPDSFENIALTTAQRADQTLVIAPETDEVLEDHYALVKQSGSVWCGVNPEAISVCTDKLATFEYLTRAGVPTIKTWDWQPGAEPNLPAVIKPRFGAGCESTFVVRSREDWPELDDQPFVVQPYISGSAWSVAAIRNTTGWEILPAVSQHITGTEQLEYVGGSLTIPESIDVTTIALQAVQAVGATSGWIGIDLVSDSDGHMRVVELNPRLTTSYIGYQRATTGNLAKCLLGLTEQLEWKPGEYAYSKHEHR